MGICVVSEVMTGPRDNRARLRGRGEKDGQGDAARKQGWKKILSCERREGRQIEKKQKQGDDKSGTAKVKWKQRSKGKRAGERARGRTRDEERERGGECESTLPVLYLSLSFHPSSE